MGIFQNKYKNLSRETILTEFTWPIRERGNILHFSMSSFNLFSLSSVILRGFEVWGILLDILKPKYFIECEVKIF